jgi:PAS domain S-box-containing protein
VKDESRTQGQLTDELVELRRRIAELETLEAERKGAEEALRRNEATLSSIFRAAPVGIGLVSDRALRQVNDRLCEMVGYSSDELVGKSARILYPSEQEFERVGREKYAQIRAVGTGTMETRWQRKDGAVIHVLLSSSAVNPSDPSEGVTFTALDISERKRTEEALRKSEVKFRALAELTPSAIFIIQGDRFVYVNSATATITGYSRDELLSMPCWKVIHPDMHQVVKERCLAYQRGEQVAPRYEIKLSSKEGRARWGAFASTLFEYEGNPAVLGTVFDITDRKGVEQGKSRLETQLRQAQKMEAIGTLAGGIAHDFNNILAAIIGFTEMALSKVPRESPVRRHLEQVLNAGSRATDLVRQILPFSHQTELERKPIPVAPLVKEALKLLRSSLPTTIDIR